MECSLWSVDTVHQLVLSDLEVFSFVELAGRGEARAN